MAKRKTNVRNKAEALNTDPREDMYKGKDRVTTAEEEETETEDTDIEAVMEATPPNLKVKRNQFRKMKVSIKKDTMTLKSITIRSCLNGSKKRKS